jgi:uncharacterized protein
MKEVLMTLLTLGAVLGASESGSSVVPGAAPRQVLVYTRNFTPDGKGYVHDNIPNSILAIRQLGQANGFAVTASDDPGMFTAEKLKPFQALIFANANNQAFTSDDQRTAFKNYIHHGGGFVGIHIACGVEREWPWYWGLVGAKFIVHPPFGPFTITVQDHTHLSTAHLGDTWFWRDEFYITGNLNPAIHVLLTGDLATSTDPTLAEKFPLFGHQVPLAWCHVYEGGRSWYTTLGHDKEVYLKDAKFRQHLLGGILWAMGDGPLLGQDQAAR